jgi:hypothetical protein
LVLVVAAAVELMLALPKVVDQEEAAAVLES